MKRRFIMIYQLKQMLNCEKLRLKPCWWDLHLPVWRISLDFYRWCWDSAADGWAGHLGTSPRGSSPWNTWVSLGKSIRHIQEFNIGGMSKSRIFHDFPAMFDWWRVKDGLGRWIFYLDISNFSWFGLRFLGCRSILKICSSSLAGSLVAADGLSTILLHCLSGHRWRALAWKHLFKPLSGPQLGGGSGTMWDHSHSRPLRHSVANGAVWKKVWLRENLNVRFAAKPKPTE